jgi:hypothetical protein
MNLVRRAVIAAVVWWWSAAPVAMAHPLDPSLLEITESSNATLEVLWRPSSTQSGEVSLQPILPAGCTNLTTPTVSQGGPRATVRWRMGCAGGLVGQRVGVQGLRERQTDALLRVHLADGRSVKAVLRGDTPAMTIPEGTGALDVLRGYLGLGLEHILTGPDHLLFVLGLVLLARGRRLLLWTITAFTAGHSVTLSLAALGLVNIPPKPVEVLIALTIFVVAVELSGDAHGRTGWMQRYPWAVAFAFGLLHGLGFAGALTQVGFPTNEIPLALFSFNVGIEAGQLLFVGLVLAARAALRQFPIRWPEIVSAVPAYAIGSLAVRWIFERIAAIF